MRFAILFLLILVLLLIGSPAFAISETNYDEVYSQRVEPYFQEKGIAGSFSGKDGVSVVYRSFTNPSEVAKLVILPGRTEPLRKYAELVYDLQDLGFSIYLLEHRGQGESGRILANPEIQYVEDFGDYIEDLYTFLVGLKASQPQAPLFLLAHSMGGAIGALTAMRYPHYFDAIILSAPMFKINTAPYSETFAYDLAVGASSLGFGKCFGPQQGNYRSDQMVLGQLTQSQVRHQMSLDIFEKHPELRMGGPSYRWFLNAFQAGYEIAERIQNAQGWPQVPVLLLQAGQDSIVLPQAQNEFCDRVSVCQLQTFPEARHEILMERDDIRDEALHRIKTFLRDHLSK